MSDPSKKKKPVNRYPWYAARFWHGMRMGDWFGLLRENRFRIHPLRLGLAATVSMASVFNSCFGPLQKLFYGRKIRETELIDPTVFIIGHWRSGTTYLHDLMSLDDRYTFADSYQCFAPHHFLVTDWWIQRIFFFMIPSKRPMDNVPVGWSRPQEDEFALMAMGERSPYRRMAFPRNGLVDAEYLNMEGIPAEDLQRWQTALLHFCRAVTCRRKKPLILKSPTHTGRVGVLSKLFPHSKFIHISRDPYSVYSSSVRLWLTLDELHGFQLPDRDGISETIHQMYERMYDGLEKQRAALPPERIYDVKYEDIVADPVGQLRAMYEFLELGDFEHVRGPLEKYLEQTRGYKTNPVEMDDASRAEVNRRWAGYFERYGYEMVPAGQQPQAAAEK